MVPSNLAKLTCHKYRPGARSCHSHLEFWQDLKISIKYVNHVLLVILRLMGTFKNVFKMRMCDVRDILEVTRLLVTPQVYHIHHSFLRVYLPQIPQNMRCSWYPWGYSASCNTSGISHTPQLHSGRNITDPIGICYVYDTLGVPRFLVKSRVNHIHHSFLGVYISQILSGYVMYMIPLGLPGSS